MPPTESFAESRGLAARRLSSTFCTVVAPERFTCTLVPSVSVIIRSFASTLTPVPPLRLASELAAVTETAEKPLASMTLSLIPPVRLANTIPESVSLSVPEIP